MADVTRAEGSAGAVSGLTAAFMLDGKTYRAGSERGFEGLDFYVGGRCGVLGDVDADVVTSAMVFWNPETVRAQWEAAGRVMSRQEASELFVDCMARWADANLDDSIDWARLSELAAKIVHHASVAAAPLFAGWRALPVPADPVFAALHHMNCLRELRMARHGSAVVAVGLDPADAVRHNSPYMTKMFGWDEAEVTPEVAGLWSEAEALTNRATERDYAVLSDEEAAELVALGQAAIGQRS